MFKNGLMKNIYKKCMGTTITIALIFSLIPLSTYAAVNPELGNQVQAPMQSGVTSGLSLETIADQTARIVVASATGGVNWGNEPVVLTLRANPVDAILVASVLEPGLLDASFSGANHNVLTLTPKGITGVTKVTVTATKDGVTVTKTFKVTINKFEDTGNYKWDDMQIPGGGFVDGYVFHPNVANILYARTDVGGAWKYNFTTQKWECISNWVRDSISGSPAQLLGIAVDPDISRASYVYIAYGSSGTIARSTDYGQSWVVLGNAGGSAAGNQDGRGLGERLIVMPGDGKTLLYGSMSTGLRKSTDGGLTWTGINLIHNTGVRNTTTNETKIGFVNYDPSNPNFIVVSTSGANGNPVNSAVTRGASVFYSIDGGTTFQELPDQPLPGAQAISGSRYYGYIGYRSTFSKLDANGNRYMFITYSDSGSSSMGMEGQGADGCLFRYKISSTGQILDYTNITPVRVTNTYIKNTDGLLSNRQFGVGVSGVSVDPEKPGVMICSTHNSDFNSPDPTLESRSMDTIYRSLDYGETWFPILAGYDMYGNLDFQEKVPYLNPVENGATNNKDGQTPEWEPWTFVHWMSCAVINPFDSNMALFNTGAGAYITTNLTSLDKINAAEPHAVPAAGLTPLQGLFTSANGVATGDVSSRYNAYLIGNNINKLTATQSVKWEGMTGLEMTVHMGSGLYSPPSGDAILLDMLGDHGGFAFTSTTKIPSNAFAYPRQIPVKYQDLTGGKDFFATDAWITGRNASYAALNPDVMVATVSGSWHYNNYGSAIFTLDNAKTWYSLPDGWVGGANRPEYAKYGIGNGMPGGATGTLQKAVNALKTSANSSSGNVVTTADGKNIIWEIANTNISNQVYTTDYGQNWAQCQYFNTAGVAVTSGSSYLVPDDVNPNIVYAFCSSSTMYVSQDGGKTFRQATTNYGSFSTSSLASINGSREIRPDLDIEGVIYIGGNNLWKLTYDKVNNIMSAVQTTTASTVTRYGSGIGVNADKSSKTLYVYGNKAGAGQQSGYGIWRSIDGGTNWVKITTSTDNPTPAGTSADPYLNSNIQYSNVASVVGDSRTFGRVYLSIGNASGGAIYGDMITNLVQAGVPDNIQLADDAVVKAEGSNLQVDYNAAKTLVDALTDGTSKADLTSRLVAVKAILEATATAAVVKAEGSNLQADYDAAKTLVNILTAGTINTDLTSRLVSVKAVIDAAVATTAVVKAEGSKLQADYDAAKTLVDGLTAGSAMTDLTSRLVTVKAGIDAAVKSATESLAITAVIKAEGSKLQADYTAAKILVDGLTVGPVKTNLTDRLNTLKIVIDAAKPIIINDAKTVIYAIKAASDKAVLTVDVSTNKIVAKEIFDAIKGTNKTVIFIQNGIQWTFNGKDITEDTKAIDMTVTIATLKNSTSPNKAAIANKVKNTDVLIISFANNEKLPGKATIRVKLDDTWLSGKDKNNVYIYYYNPTTLKAEIVAQKLKVDGEGYVQFTITHNSDYFVSDKDLVQAGIMPKTGYAMDTTVMVYLGIIALFSGVALILLRRKRTS